MVVKSAKSLGVSVGKTNQLKTGTLTTSSATADQSIVSHVVTANKTFYVQYFCIDALFDTLSATATKLGTWSIETPTGTKVITLPETNPTTSSNEPFVLSIAEPIPVASSQVVRIVCTPSTATTMVWYGSVGGFEK